MSTKIAEDIGRSDVGNDAPNVWHKYPSTIYFGIRPPIGERALCGHVKVDPTCMEDVPAEVYARRGKCVVCYDLFERIVGR